MSSNSKYQRERIEQPGRFALTIECADDLSNDEIIRMEAVLEAQVCLLQKQKRGYTAAHLTAWQGSA